MKNFEIAIFVVAIIVVALFLFSRMRPEEGANALPCTCPFIWGPINCPRDGICPGSSKTRCNPNC